MNLVPTASVQRIATVLVLLPLLLSFQDAAQVSTADLVKRADAAYAKNDFATARLLYRQFLDGRPGGADAERASFRVAEATLRDGTLEEPVRLNGAIEAFELAIARYPASPLTPAAYLTLGRTYIGLGLVQDAIIKLREAREKLPDAPNAEALLLLLADSYYQIEDFAQAVVHYGSFIDQYPDARATAEVRLKLADSYHRLKDYPHARSLFETILAADRNALNRFPVLRFQYAETLMFTGDLDGAERELAALEKGNAPPEILPHVQFRRADIHRLRSRVAAAAADDTKRVAERDEAMRQFAAYYQAAVDPRLAESAALRLVKLADEAKVDIAAQFKLPDADTLLNTMYERNLDPFVRSLILTRLARHHREAGRALLSLQYYKRLADEYHGVALADEVSSEFHRYLRELLDAAWKARDYGSFLDVYLGYGLALELSLQERLRLGVCYSHIQLYDKAEAEFSDLLKFGLKSEDRRLIAMERIEIYFRRHNSVATLREIAVVLSLDPTPAEREHALLMKQEVYFADRDLAKLQGWYMEGNIEDFNTPLLRSSLLFKLGALQFLKSNYGEAEAYLDQFFNEFGEGGEGDRRLYSLIWQATISMADIYFHQDRYPEALQLYERYIFFEDPQADISWPLLQAAYCRRQLRQTRLATEMLKEFVRLYPKHFLRPEAEKAIADIAAAAAPGGR